MEAGLESSSMPDEALVDHYQDLLAQARRAIAGANDSRRPGLAMVEEAHAIGVMEGRVRGYLDALIDIRPDLAHDCLASYRALLDDLDCLAVLPDDGNGVPMHAAEAGQRPLVVLLHGFP